MTPENKAKVKADIEKIQATEEYKTSTHALAKAILKLEDKLVEVSPEIKSKLTATIADLKVQLKKLKASEGYHNVREGLSQTVHELAEKLEEGT